MKMTKKQNVEFYILLFRHFACDPFIKLIRILNVSILIPQLEWPLTLIIIITSFKLTFHVLNIQYNSNEGFSKFTRFLCVGANDCVITKEPMSDAHCNHTTPKTPHPYCMCHLSSISFFF